MYTLHNYQQIEFEPPGFIDYTDPQHNAGDWIVLRYREYDKEERYNPKWHVECRKCHKKSFVDDPGNDLCLCETKPRTCRRCGTVYPEHSLEYFASYGRRPSTICLKCNPPKPKSEPKPKAAPKPKPDNRDQKIKHIKRVMIAIYKLEQDIDIDLKSMRDQLEALCETLKANDLAS